ncbi:MAG TPA: TerC family protein [Burkholderiales bacterium]
MENLTNPEIWIALVKIAVINVVLSGDNAVVIALACRNLPPKQQRNAFLIGTGGIVVLMTVLTAAAAYLLTLPYLELVGSVLLLWIGVKLLIAEDEADEGSVKSGSTFWEAVRLVIIADMVMSLDNVLGMAAAAKGHLGMLFIGMVITIPLILFGAAMIMKLMERFPILIIIGAGLLGYVAGEMATSDPLVKAFFEEHSILERAVPIVGALFVVITGKVIERRHKARAAAEVPSP